MRDVDLVRLAEPYSGAGHSAGLGLARALGINTPNLRQLEADIRADLSERPPYGIGWWAPHPGTSRRILISDQLVACVHSVSENLVEARLHELEYLDYADQHSDFFADAVRIEHGEPTISAPKPLSPRDELSLYLARLHLAGGIRALSGALDCLAGVVVGIVGLPRRILRADFVGVRAALKDLSSTASTEGHLAQAAFGSQLEASVKSAGPVGWLDWLLALRNMLVHRGRRIELAQFVPREPVLLDPTGRPIVRVKVVTHLPLDPARSDVEVLLEPSNIPVLTEDAAQTLRGTIESAHWLIEQVSENLLHFWRWRRSRPHALAQPESQWPRVPSTLPAGFPGYSPGSVDYSPDLMMLNPELGRRLRAAALDDSARSQWRTFD